jgi:hypothetical protein
VVVERTWRNAGTKNYFTFSSEWRGKLRRAMKGLKIPFEAVCVMILIDSKVYGYTENLSYILFKYKNVGGTLKLLYCI